MRYVLRIGSWGGSVGTIGAVEVEVEWRWCLIESSEAPPHWWWCRFVVSERVDASCVCAMLHPSSCIIVYPVTCIFNSSLRHTALHRLADKLRAAYCDIAYLLRFP